MMDRERPRQGVLSMASSKGHARTHWSLCYIAVVLLPVFFGVVVSVGSSYWPHTLGLGRHRQNEEAAAVGRAGALLWR